MNDLRFECSYDRDYHVVYVYLRLQHDVILTKTVELPYRGKLDKILEKACKKIRKTQEETLKRYVESIDGWRSMEELCSKMSGSILIEDCIGEQYPITSETTKEDIYG